MFNSFQNNSSSERTYTQRELLELERQEKALSKWRKEEAERKKKKSTGDGGESAKGNKGKRNIHSFNGMCNSIKIMCRISAHR